MKTCVYWDGGFFKERWQYISLQNSTDECKLQKLVAWRATVSFERKGVTYVLNFIKTVYFIPIYGQFTLISVITLPCF